MSLPPHYQLEDRTVSG